MPKSNANIKTFADFANSSYDENNPPNVRTTNQQSMSSYEGRVNNNSIYPNANQSVAAAAATAAVALPAVYHIPTLYNDQYALQLLQRVVQEFIPIIQRRQYNVISISELCCCNDGLDFQTDRNNKKRRKIHKLSNNIWGYNRTTWRTGFHNNNNNQQHHTIHLRLRHATDHTKFLLYEDVAGTLAHELSHCEFGPHNKDFFKLMDDILDEHANLMATSMFNSTFNTRATSSTSITPFSGTGQTLGSATTNWTGLANGRRLGDADNSATIIATTTGQMLGGDGTFVQWMTPKEAAVIAAETRRRQQQLRLRGDHCCRPCYNDIDMTENDVEDNEPYNSVDLVDALDESTIAVNNVTKRSVSYDDSGLIENIYNVADVKPPFRRDTTVANMIDLTETDDDNDDDGETNMNFYPTAPPTNIVPYGTIVNFVSTTEWNCHRCTFRNRPMSLVCDMCSTTKDII